MKNYFILLVIILTTLVACNPNDDNTPPGNQNMNATEQQLVGQWKLKRSEKLDSRYYPGFGDSVIEYINHYNYINSQLDLSSTPSGYANQYIISYVGFSDDSGPDANERWYFDENLNYFYIDGVPYIIKYLSSDSLVIDLVGGYPSRHFFNKNTITPSMNNIESQLIGTWRLMTINGVSNSPWGEYYYKFYPNWYSDEGFYKVDSGYGVDYDINPFIVLYPELQTPILLSNFGLGSSLVDSYSPYHKITHLDNNTLTLEILCCYYINSETSDTLEFEKQ